MPKQTFYNLNEAKRNAIVKASIEEFSIHTYNEASVNTIVERSGISKGSLYQYFEDKKDIYLYLIEYAGQAKLEYLQAHSPISFDDFYEGLCTLMIQGTQFSLQNPLYSRLLYKAFQGPLVDESLARLKELNRDYMTRLLGDAMEKGDIRNDVAIDVMVFFLNALTTEFAQFVAEKAGMSWDEVYCNEEALRQLDIPAVIRHLMKLVKHGLAPVKNN